VEYHRASWLDRGLSYPSLVDRQNISMIRSLVEMMLSKDDNN
jgi:hypothetical protein